MNVLSSATPVEWSVPLVAAKAVEVPPAPKRWTREEYMRLADQGFFEGQRVELLDGEIVIMSPPSPQHSGGTVRVDRLLRDLFDEGYVIWTPGTLVAGDRSQVEPDVSVVRGEIAQFDHAHPETAILVVEVAKTSLAYDVGRKKHLYALMNVTEYWVLDVVSRRLIVHREPVDAAEAPFGRDYASIVEVTEGGSISPLAAPQATLAVADMLPSLAAPSVAEESRPIEENA